MERTNKVYIVGTLKEVEQRLGEKDGRNYVGGKVVIETRDSMIEMKYFSFEMTEKGINKRYQNYRDLETLKGRRVKATGEISGRAFWQASQGQLIEFNELSLSFMNVAKDTDPAVATFEYSGWVSTPLNERMDKEGKALLAYEIELAQANYNGDNMQKIKFTVDPKASKIVAAINQYYHKNSTVAVQGEIHYIPQTETRTEEVAFGDPIVKTFTSVHKRFLITAGKSPILDDLAYSAEQISNLEGSYKSYLETVEREAKSEVESGRSVSNPTPPKSGLNTLL